MADRIAWVPYETPERAAEVLGDHDGVQYVPFLTSAEPPAGPVHFLVVPYAQPPAVLDHLGGHPELQVIQAQMAGTDAMEPRIPEGVTLCNAAGVHDTATAEVALALMLARARRIDEYSREQVDGTWAPRWAPGLADRRVTMIGYGHIGKAIERRLAGFECASITPVATSARTEQVDGREVQLRGIDELDQLLPSTDVLIIIAPLNDATRGLVDAQALAALPDGAMVVNVGRGPIVDTQALVEACATGRITAAMDVIDPEPVPADHPLRTTPGVLFSPHVGGFSNAFEPRRDALLRRQVAAWAAGQELDNVVTVGPR